MGRSACAATFVATLAVTLGQCWRMLGWVAAVAGNGLLNTALKQMFARVRRLGLDGSLESPQTTWGTRSRRSAQH